VTLAPDAVRSMFDRIAPVYDAMNRVMTAGLDVRWRRHGAETVDDLLDFVVARVLDQIGLDNALIPRWGQA
jgi:ubiquinone/menaquinone biosynthesis C-methylase UbiE